MTTDDQRRPATARLAHVPRRLPRPRAVVRRLLWVFARPYARRRMRQAEMASALERLEADLEHVRVRHTEQIDRLEELVHELVLTAESLRRRTSREDGGDR